MMKERFGTIIIIKSIIWKMLERGSSILVMLLVNVVLSRLLAPDDFGLSAMVTVFVALSTIFVTSGMSNALIQKKNIDETDYSTMFWINVVVSGILYLLLFALSPSIASFFGCSQLKPMLRVLSISILIAAINSIQCAYIAKNMLFRYYFFSTLFGKIGSGFIGVSLALTGCGVWAIVFQALSMIFIETCVLWFRVKWRPQIVFSLDRAKELFSFAWKIMLMSFVEAISDQLRNLIIGKKYSSAELAYYDKGVYFPNSIVTNVSSSLSAVMFPVMSDAQDDYDRRKTILRRWTSVYAYCTFPVLVGLIIIAKPLISVLLTDKWLMSVPYLQIACVLYAAWVIELPIRETIKSLGHAGICLKMQVIKTIFALGVLLTLMNLGVMTIALGTLGCSAFNIIVSMFYGNMYADYTPKQIFIDLLPTIVINIIMGFCIYSIVWIGLSILVTLVLQIITGVIIYLCISRLFNIKSYSYLVNAIRGLTDGYNTNS